MNYLGYKMLKSEFNNDKALEIAAWCNETQSATWQDMGDYYECVEVEPPEPHEPTVEEKLEQLSSDYQKARFELGVYYMEAVLDGNIEVQEELQHELVALKAQYDEDVANVEG